MQYASRTTELFAHMTDTILAPLQILLSHCLLLLLALLLLLLLLLPFLLLLLVKIPAYAKYHNCNMQTMLPNSWQWKHVLAASQNAHVTKQLAPSCVTDLSGI